MSGPDCVPDWTVFDALALGLAQAGYRHDGATDGAHPADETCDCPDCLAAHGTYKPGHSGGLAF